jgi:hypothetical protein
MLELRIINAGQALPLFDLPMHLGRRRAVREVGDTIETLISYLDDLGGDPDLEEDADEEGPGAFRPFANDALSALAEHRDAAIALQTEDDEADGDEEDGNGSEDDFMEHRADGPGCPIADIDKGDEEDGDRSSWAEWHTLPPLRRRAGEIDGKPKDGWHMSLSEDAEDDDPDTGVEDNPQGFDPETDCCVAGRDGVFSGNAVDFGANHLTEAHRKIGSEDDAEHDYVLSYRVDQTLPLMVDGSNDR